jgi:hypothetical protein
MADCSFGRKSSEAAMNEAWHIFCRPGTNFIEHYVCRGTKLIGDKLKVKVHKVKVEALARSRYNGLQICLGYRSKLQKM